MPSFERQELDVNGVKTVVLSSGSGDPVVFLHGAGTMTGFDFALPLAERYRLIVPIHPGYSDSGDDPSISSVHDYVLHYLDLFDQLGLDSLRLVGHSLGGWMAATFAIEQTKRVEKLALVSPAGLRVPEAPTADLFSIPPEALLPALTENLEIFEGKMSNPPDLDFIVARYRESASFAQVAWERIYDPKLSKWLHRLTMPTLILWGEKDQIIPAAQADAWARLIPEAQVKVLPDRGHLVLEETPDALGVIGDFLS
ncbi:MAG TPA: alpha/beta hydrolase [Acidimicrobiales bacterium]|nr:alpha/beta hydrolase [Acidimicrobiales bacterium]